MDTVIFRKEWVEALKPLDEQTRTAATMAVLEYAFDGKTPQDPLINALTALMRGEIDRNSDKYQQTCQKRAWRKSTQGQTTMILQGQTTTTTGAVDEVANAAPLQTPANEAPARRGRKPRNVAGGELLQEQTTTTTGAVDEVANASEPARLQTPANEAEKLPKKYNKQGGENPRGTISETLMERVAEISTPQMLTNVKIKQSNPCEFEGLQTQTAKMFHEFSNAENGKKTTVEEARKNTITPGLFDSDFSVNVTEPMRLVNEAAAKVKTMAGVLAEEYRTTEEEARAVVDAVASEWIRLGEFDHKRPATHLARAVRCKLRAGVRPLAEAERLKLQLARSAVVDADLAAVNAEPDGLVGGAALRAWMQSRGLDAGTSITDAMLARGAV